jgi:esterase/lipase superfamily enzyme
MAWSDKIRKDGRTINTVFQLKTLHTKIIGISGEYITLEGFSHRVWDNDITTFVFGRMAYFTIGEYNKDKWMLIFYAEA